MHRHRFRCRCQTPHNLPEKGGPEFARMPHFKAREVVVAAITKIKIKNELYKGAIDNEVRQSFCSKTKDVVEPLIKPQWCVSCSGILVQTIAIMSKVVGKNNAHQPTFHFFQTLSVKSLISLFILFILFYFVFIYSQMTL